MGIFFVYILKSSVCLAGFYLFYRLLLSKETFSPFQPDCFAEPSAFLFAYPPDSGDRCRSKRSAPDYADHRATAVDGR